MTDIYARQSGLPIREYERVAIIGVGGVGSWVALFEAMTGTEKIYLVDGDILEVHNLNRLPFQERDVGVRKNEVVLAWIREHIQSVRKDCDVVLLPYLNDVNIVLIEDAQLVYDCTDKLAIQNMIYKFCKEKGIHYIHPGYNGEHITISHSSEDVWGEGDGYRVTPSFVAPTVCVAAMAVHSAHYAEYSHTDVSFNLSDVLGGKFRLMSRRPSVRKKKALSLVDTASVPAQPATNDDDDEEVEDDLDDEAARLGALFG